MSSSYCLSKHHGHINTLKKYIKDNIFLLEKNEIISIIVFNKYRLIYLNFLTLPHVFILRDSIGYNYSFKTSIIDPRQCWARENSMS